MHTRRSCYGQRGQHVYTSVYTYWNDNSNSHGSRVCRQLAAVLYYDGWVLDLTHQDIAVCFSVLRFSTTLPNSAISSFTLLFIVFLLDYRWIIFFCLPRLYKHLHKLVFQHYCSENPTVICFFDALCNIRIYRCWTKDFYEYASDHYSNSRLQSPLVPRINLKSVYRHRYCHAYSKFYSTYLRPFNYNPSPDCIVAYTEAAKRAPVLTLESHTFLFQLRLRVLHVCPPILSSKDLY